MVMIFLYSLLLKTLCGLYSESPLSEALLKIIPKTNIIIINEEE